MTRPLAAAAVLLLLAGCGGSDKAGTSGLKVTGTVTASGAPSAQTVRLGMDNNLSPLRCAIFAVSAKCGAGGSSAGGMHISPAMASP